MEAEDRDLFIQFHHDGESYEGEADEWAKSKVGERVKEIAEVSFKAGRASRKEEIEELMDYAFKDGERIGRREVVERYKRENPSAYKKYQLYWDNLEKEWGIKEGKS